MISAIFPIRKLGQADLISTPVKVQQFGWTQTVFHSVWAVFPDLHSCTLQLQMTMNHMTPITGVTNKSMALVSKQWFPLTLETVIGH